MRRAPDANQKAATPGPLPLPALLLLAGLGAGITAQGAFYLPGQAVVGLVLAAAAATAAGRARAAGTLVSPVPELSVLATWAVVRGGLAGEPLAGAGAAVLLLGMAACIAVCRQLSRGQAETFVQGLIALGVVVSLTGWVGVAFHYEPWALTHGGLWRASSTLTYANAAAGLTAPLCLLAVALLVSRPQSLLRRLAVMLLMAGSIASLSRAGGLLLVAGLAALAGGLGFRRVLRVAPGPLCGAAVALAGLAPSIVQGGPGRPVPATLGLLAGMTATWAVGRASPRHSPAAGTAVLGAAVLFGFFFPPVRSAVLAVTDSRLTLGSEDRANETKAALRVAASHPVFGAGPGRAELQWEGPAGPSQATYVHNEYLQVLAEYGLLGLGLLGTGVAGAVRRARDARRAVRPAELWLGGAAALAVFGAHSAADFLWHIPVIPLVMAALIGIITPTVQHNDFQEV